jgi:hypothetical protein
MAGIESARGRKVEFRTWFKGKPIQVVCDFRPCVVTGLRKFSRTYIHGHGGGGGGYIHRGTGGVHVNPIAIETDIEDIVECFLEFGKGDELHMQFPPDFHVRDGHLLVVIWADGECVLVCNPQTRDVLWKRDPSGFLINSRFEPPPRRHYGQLAATVGAVAGGLAGGLLLLCSFSALAAGRQFEALAGVFGCLGLLGLLFGPIGYFLGRSIGTRMINPKWPVWKEEYDFHSEQVEAWDSSFRQALLKVAGRIV